MAILFQTAKFKSANTQFGGKPPNLITANISNYTVHFVDEMSLGEPLQCIMMVRVWNQLIVDLQSPFHTCTKSELSITSLSAEVVCTDEIGRHFVFHLSVLTEWLKLGQIR